MADALPDTSPIDVVMAAWEAEMNDNFERLFSLRVADVMSNGVVQVDRAASMDRAAGMMREAGVSSAPVVDDQGRCVGVLSASDFLRRECSDATSYFTGEAVKSRMTPDTPLSIEPNSRCDVGRYMSGGVQSISPECPLLQAAQVMVSAHVHRLPVLDDGGRPVGVVSSMDVVSALLNVLDERNVAELNRGRQ